MAPLARRRRGISFIAAETLGTLRPRDTAVVEVLTEAQRDPDENVRQAAAEALRKLKK